MDIARATRPDIPALCRLLAILFEQEAEFRPERSRQEAGLARIIDAPETGIILLARTDDAVFGMVNMLYTTSTALGGRVALLEDLVVDPAHRGRGTGSALLAAAIASARGAGCLRITLLTDSANERAHRLYRRHGFSASSMMPMRLGLER